MASVADLADEVEIEAAPGALTIRPSTHPRAGWTEAAAAFDRDGLLDQMTSTRFDDEEWSWRQKKLSQGGICNRWTSLSFLIRCRLDDQDAHVVEAH
jgi:hypothetical protein